LLLKWDEPGQNDLAAHKSFLIKCLQRSLRLLGEQALRQSLSLE
jgi:hypothetical protein